jgi:hypothetical protein
MSSLLEPGLLQNDLANRQARRHRSTAGVQAALLPASALAVISGSIAMTRR